MNNVYIGARYVPKFDGDYDSTKTYEPLTIVNWGGASYTSKRTVPAGILPSDNNYWAMTGNYNGQIAHLQQEIDAHDIHLDAINNSIANIETSITALGNRVSDDETAISNLNNGLSNLTNRVNNIATKRHILLIGDSYAQGIGGGGTTFESKMEEFHSWDVRTFAEGGCGYLRYNDQDHRMYEVLQNAIANTSDKEIITDVLLCCSAFNDIGCVAQPNFNENGYINALTQINNLVKANLPSARITCAPALWINTTYNTDYIKIWEWTRSACQIIGCNYSTNSINWLSVYGDEVQAGDNVHPSALGHTILANHLATLINGSEPALYNGVNIVTTATNDILTIKYNRENVTIVGSISKEAGQTFNSLFDVPAPLSKLTNFPIFMNKYGSKDCIAFLITGSTTYCPSDWLDEGTTYKICETIPYEVFS